MISLPKIPVLESKEYTEWSILSMYRGSISHGTYLPSTSDDVDLFAVCVPPIDRYLGIKFFGRKGTINTIQEDPQGIKWDIVMHEVRKFFHLLRKGNPNVHALLWLKPEHYLKKTAAGQLILTHKTNFFSKHIYNAFMGYSRSEMSKIEKMVYGKAGQRGRSLIRKHGYNTINASHTIRLLRMLNEFLETREFFTYREHDADELIAIKTGKVDKDTVINEALKLLSKAESLFKEISWLPENTDRETLSRLCVDVAKTAYQERGSEW